MKHETMRASQLNGCAFCVDMHVKEAKPPSTASARSRAAGGCDERRCLWSNGVDRAARR